MKMIINTYGSFSYRVVASGQYMPRWIAIVFTNDNAKICLPLTLNKQLGGFIKYVVTFKQCNLFRCSYAADINYYIISY